MPRLRSLILLIFLLPSLAFAVEIPLTEPQYGPASDVQYQSVAASDGGSYFVLWTDGRSRDRETWGTRVSREGQILDRTGIRLFEGEMLQPRMIWTGTSYLVVWSTTNPDTMWMLRIDRDGRVIDPARAIIAGALPTSLARNNSQVVIGFRRGNEIHAMFVTQDGQPLIDVRLPAANEQHDGPQIAWNGLHFVAIWTAFGETSNRVEGVRFGQGGALEREPRVLVSDGAIHRARIASDGNDFVIVSSIDSLGGLHVARRVSADLTTVGPAVTLPEEIYADASILWTGTNYVVVAASGPVTSGVRLGSDARLLDADAITIEAAPPTGASASPSVTTNGGDLFIAWTGRIVPDFEQSIDVYGSLTSSSTLASRSRALLSITAPRQTRPVIAHGVSSLLAVWNEPSGVWAKRLALNGASIDGVPIRLFDKEGVIATTFNGSDYIVAWTDSRTIRTVRVHRDGTLRADGGGQIAAWDGFSLALASNGASTALVMSGNAARVVELGPDGSFFGPPRTLATAVVGTVDIAVGAGGVFLVAWGEMEFLPPTFETAQPKRVMATRLLPSLINLHPAPITIADTSAFEGEPAIAWNGSEWLVVWTEAKQFLRAQHVSTSGTLSGGGAYIAADAMLPDVTWDGSRYVFAWLGIEGGFPKAFRAAWISRIGTPPTHTVELGEAEFWPPSPIFVNTVLPGDVIFSYARVAREPQYGSVARAFVNIGRPPATRRRAVE